MMEQPFHSNTILLWSTKVISTADWDRKQDRADSAPPWSWHWFVWVPFWSGLAPDTQISLFSSILAMVNWGALQSWRRAQPQEAGWDFKAAIISACFSPLWSFAREWAFFKVIQIKCRQRKGFPVIFKDFKRLFTRLPDRASQEETNQPARIF